MKLEQETYQQNKQSLGKLNQSITPPESAGFFSTLRVFLGPGALVAVGYMDPGNWITSVIGGASYRYSLLFVVLLSSLMAMQLQQMAGKLGIVTQQDLAQITATNLAKPFRYILFIIIELALMATDLAEVIGSGIALHLLFGWPLTFSICITILDVFLLLLLLKFGVQKIEALVTTLIFTILIIFLYLVILSKPDFQSLFRGYFPSASLIESHPNTENTPLTLALGIIGATVMPHNLYLHSALSQTRKVDTTSTISLQKSIRFMTWDSNIQLTLAFIVNSLLLILGASLFYGHSSQVSAFSQMYNALSNNRIVGTIASSFLSTLFALALLASGQNSTITGTLTGQVVMEGFLHLRLPQWLIRLITRGLALLPVLILSILFGSQEKILDQLIVYSQVFLSVALPFSIFPLIYFTSRKKYMGVFVNAKWNTYLAYTIASLLSILNIKLIINLFING
ncbi:Nramp family divalent metal transporter [Streptococcus gallinaceus]|uniref:Manganese transport protein n=1 Tax=Streptococcus gallinaceus TaxID=165758 RepID=A0ABV2JKC5_9STRE|nr:Nramp family divalent metal transporter [Streptococcus gallinaceus]MCP1638739.1 manganese transport protein [Streptococcus gallinaceus]MCP1769174.1 manganese transport protein [Streptococcus gallinaceus]